MLKIFLFVCFHHNTILLHTVGIGLKESFGQKLNLLHFKQKKKKLFFFVIRDASIPFLPPDQVRVFLLLTDTNTEMSKIPSIKQSGASWNIFFSFMSLAALCSW